MAFLFLVSFLFSFYKFCLNFHAVGRIILIVTCQKWEDRISYFASKEGGNLTLSVTCRAAGIGTRLHEFSRASVDAKLEHELSCFYRDEEKFEGSCPT